VAATLDCDVLIVGTGLVGAVYARHLVAAGLSVVMVDAGPQLSARPGEHLRNRYLHQRDLRLYYDALVAHLYPPSVPAAAEPLFPGEAHLPPQAAGGNAVNPEQDPRRNLPGAAVTYAVGGMGVLWTCLAPRLHPGIERFPFFSPEEWEDLYARAETDLGVGREAFRGSRRGAALLAQLHAAGRAPSWRRSRRGGGRTTPGGGTRRRRVPAAGRPRGAAAADLERAGLPRGAEPGRRVLDHRAPREIADHHRPAAHLDDAEPLRDGHADVAGGGRGRARAEEQGQREERARAQRERGPRQRRPKKEKSSVRTRETMRQVASGK